MMRTLVLSTLSILLAACGSTGPVMERNDTVNPPESTKSTAKPSRPKAVLKRGGGYYKDDGPGDEIPDNLDEVPDAVPRWEPLHKPATRPYVVLGKQYVPQTQLQAYKAQGIASWYGRKFHGQKTSIGEPYDMFAMTAAHPTLALPSYVRVTHVQNGRSVIVRLTDRGPFHADRIIDLSYTAAYKLGIVDGGSALVQVEALIPGSEGGTSFGDVMPPSGGASMTDPPLRTATKEVRPPVPRPVPGKGTYIQLGAFSSLDNAENLRLHLSRELDWVAQPMQIWSENGLHRLQLGPYAQRQQAEQVAEKIRSALGYAPGLVQR